MIDVLAAEWSKMRSGRPLRAALAVFALITALLLLLAAAFVATWDGLPPERQAQSALGSLPELLGWVATFVMAVLGALAITTEWSSGMIRTTFLAMPQRGRVLAAKAGLVAAISAVTTFVAVGVTLLGVAWIVGDRPIAGQSPLGPDSLRLSVSLALSTAVFAAIGLALGTVSRSGLVSVVTLVLTWYVVPIVAMRAPAPLDGWLGSILPGSLAGQLAGSQTPSVFGRELGPAGALGAMVLYAVVPLLIAAVLLRRRDV